LPTTKIVSTHGYCKYDTFLFFHNNPAKCEAVCVNDLWSISLWSLTTNERFVVLWPRSMPLAHALAYID